MKVYNRSRRLAMSCALTVSPYRFFFFMDGPILLFSDVACYYLTGSSVPG
jgi:hypothetical protein